ncbi:hypothetical protein DH2020_027726 [Rehmannia glutinosa]|uniref:High mobility group B protein n=1 Tax=Rehmannia glutinosa TaxID=99300 RepID=A0ABR0VTC1_REHGL
MMVEQGMGDGGDKLAMQSCYGSSYHSYPPPLATYQDVVGSRDLFMDTLKKLHVSMGTKFMIPIVGGRDLDLHRLFVEVTSRGGIAKVLKDKKWKEVTSVFSFPSSATNASFILRKYYVSLLYHYEQIYFFKAKCWTPSPTDAMQQLSTSSAQSHGLPEYATQQIHPPSPQLRTNTVTSTTEVSSLAPSAGSPVCGVIDGKFDSGYLITVKIGMEEFKGVLYQVPDNDQTQNFPDHHLQTHSESAGLVNHSLHAKLKPLYHGRDREISRIIGETWNKLQEPERAVYQEKALKDKERYKGEMEDYRERLRTGQIVRSAVPVQHRSPVPEINLTTDLNSSSLQFEGATSAYTEENEMSSDKSDESSSEECEIAEKDSDFGECSQVDMGLKNVNIEVMADEAFDLETRPDKVEQDDENKVSSGNNDVVLGDDGISVPIEEIEQQPSINASESVPGL